MHCIPRMYISTSIDVGDPENHFINLPISLTCHFQSLSLVMKSLLRLVYYQKIHRTRVVVQQYNAYKRYYKLWSFKGRYFYTKPREHRVWVYGIFMLYKVTILWLCNKCSKYYWNAIQNISVEIIEFPKRKIFLWFVTESGR